MRIMSSPGGARHLRHMNRTIPIHATGTEALDPHRTRELATIEAMFHVYCHDRHRATPATCTTCAPLLDYATRRLVRCVFGARKPTCANCTVHCYTEQMRVDIKEVMRYAGPRMMLAHPLLAIGHVLAGRRPAPHLPTTKRRARRGAGLPAEVRTT